MIYYDHTSTFRFGRTTGIQRVVRQLGASLSAQLPRDFTAVSFSSGLFYPCSLELREQRTENRFRGWLRKRKKASFWDALEQPPMVVEPVQFNKGDWYFTADALWEIPAASAKIAALRRS